MASRRERCSWCGVQLLVPPEAQTIQCSVCQAITPVWFGYNNSIGQPDNSIGQVASRLMGFLNPVSGYDYHYPQPIRTQPPLTAALSLRGRKRAFLCGVSYYGQRHRLNGSVNDIKCMKYFLVHRLGFPSDSILVLTEEETDPFRIPTKNNIRMGMQWLVQGCQSGDSLVFHYSGHGSQQRDYDGDEMDGYDETLLPVDHHTAGAILDDEINATLVRPLPQGSKLHAIIDACHSGTLIDLPFVCRMNREGLYMWEDHGRLSSTYKGTNGGLAISVSACDDHQISVDTTALSGYTSTGAMTYSFIQALQNEPGLTYGRLLNAMRTTIREAATGVSLNSPITSLIKKIFRPHLTQKPLLSSSEKFDIYSMPVVL